MHLDIFTIEIETDNILPRSPDYVFDKKYFENRFDQEPWIFTYLKHQQDGKFWQKNRSLQTDYAAINIPIYAFASLLDGYKDYAIHMLNNIKSPMKVSIGPQIHAWPDSGPGPTYNWHQMSARWWQQTLNNKDYGIWNEPRLTVFMRDSVPPGEDIENIPGKYWSTSWPVKNRSIKHFFLQSDGSLSELNDKTLATTHKLDYKPSAGNGALNWWGEETSDMRAADENTLIYDSSPIENEFSILGNPEVKFIVAVNATLADWIVRLEDVNPDGSVSFVTGGLINGAQRNSRFTPALIETDKAFTINFPLHFTTWKFAKGHRIRVTVANAQFPMIWPTPYKMVSTLFVGKNNSEIRLPFLTKDETNIPNLPAVEIDEHAPDAQDLNEEYLTPFKITHKQNGDVIAEAHESYSTRVHEVIYQVHYKTKYKVNDNKPANAEFIAEGDDVVKIQSKRVIRVHAIIKVVSDKNYFHVGVTRKVYENGKLLRKKIWKQNILRDFE